MVLVNDGNGAWSDCVVEIGRVNIENKIAVVGGIRLQAARGNGSSGFQLGK